MVGVPASADRMVQSGVRERPISRLYDVRMTYALAI